jgi:hypothetical protein
MNSSGIEGAPDSATPPLYREVQRFRHWYFYVPITIVTVIVWYQFIQQIVLGHPLGEEPVPNWVAWALTIVFGLGFPAFALTVRLITEVWPGVMLVGLYPFRRAKVSLAGIRTAETRQYSPLREFGGWGVRTSLKNGRAYNAYGDQGVQLIMNDGKRVLIGTQQPEQLLAALRLGGADTD